MGLSSEHLHTVFLELRLQIVLFQTLSQFRPVLLRGKFLQLLRLNLVGAFRKKDFAVFRDMEHGMPAGRPVAYEAGQHFPSDQIVPNCRIHHLWLCLVRRFCIGGLLRTGIGCGGEIHDLHHFEGDFEVFADRYLRMGITSVLKVRIRPVPPRIMLTGRGEHHCQVACG